MLPHTLDLTRPQEPNGRPFNRKLIVIGGVIVAGVVLTILWPALMPAPTKVKDAPKATVVRNIKDSTALKSLRSTHQGEALGGEPVPVAPGPVAATAAPDDAEAKRLKAENEQLRALLKRVPGATPSPSPTPNVVDPEVKAREEARKREERENRTLVMRKAEPSKDAGKTIMSLQRPLTPYTISPFWKIPCETEGPASNEAPGVVTVRTKQTVYDSATGHYPLIPQGTLLGLKSRGTILYGDSRLSFEATTISFPNGTWAKFSGATVADQSGLAGLTGDIDRHIFRILGSVLFTSVLQGGTTVANTMSGDPTGRVTGMVTNNVSSELQRQSRQFSRTDPTISIPAGTGCLIELEEPVSFAKPYPF